MIILMNIHPEWFGGQYRSMRYEVDWARRGIAEEAEDPNEEPTPNPDRYLDQPRRAEERNDSGELGVNRVWGA